MLSNFAVGCLCNTGVAGSCAPVSVVLCMLCTILVNDGIEFVRSIGCVGAVLVKVLVTLFIFTDRPLLPSEGPRLKTAGKDLDCDFRRCGNERRRTFLSRQPRREVSFNYYALSLLFTHALTGVLISTVVACSVCTYAHVVS